MRRVAAFSGRMLSFWFVRGIAFVLALTFVGMMRSEVTEAQLGNFGDAGASALIDQLELLRQQGQLDDLGTAESEALDRSRSQESEEQSARPNPPPPDSADSGKVRAFREYCTRADRGAGAGELVASGEFSLLELDYCRRARAPVLLFGFDQLAGRSSATAERSASRSTAPPLSAGSIPLNYVLGIGDELVVTMRGRESLTRSARVDSEGKIVLPQLEPIPAAGRTLTDFEEALRRQVESSLLDTRVFVSVGRIRRISIIVGGEVVQGGVYSTTSTSDVMNAIALAGGLRKTGSLRNVRVIRDGSSRVVDLYGALFFDGADADLTLRDGDRLVVPPTGPTVAIVGAVKRPAIFELPRSDRDLTVQEALEIAGGGVRPRGNEYVRISILNDGSQVATTVGDEDVLRDGDILQVKTGTDPQDGFVEIFGAVSGAGRYALSSNPTVASLVQSARPDDDAYLGFGILETTSPVTKSRRLFPLNIRSIQAQEKDYTLINGDKLYLLGREDLNFLTSSDVQRAIVGEVPGFDRDTLSSSIAPANQDFASRPFGAASRPSSAANRPSSAANRPSNTANQSSGAANELGRTDFSNPGEGCRGLRALVLVAAESGLHRFANATRVLSTTRRGRLLASGRNSCSDLFRENDALLSFVLEFVAGVGGEIRQPGLYPLAEETSLAEIISYAGGITPAADPNRVEIDHASTGVAGERSVFPAVGDEVANVMVSAGSIIRFYASSSPREFGTVAISGEVVRPGRYEIRKGDKLSDLLRRAGGLTPFAYPYGAVFGRESVRQAEQVGFDRAAREIQAGLARAAQDLDATELAAVQQVVGELRSTPAVGRVVVEADPTVLRVRPELDVLLEPGDRIVYPKRPPYVVVAGAVLNPTALQFEAGRDVRHYLNQAGGFQRFADRRRTFIVFPNGAASRADLGVFEYSIQRPPPGTTIVVPPDPVPLNYLGLATNLSAIFSQLAIAAASLSVIQN